MYKIGQVIVTEVNRRNWFSRAIANVTQSWATHAFVVTGANEAVEATFPRVRKFDLSERLQHLADTDRAYVVLDVPGTRFLTRMQIRRKALSYIGRWYDVGQILIRAVTGRFWNDGEGTLVCSRLVTAAYLSGAGIDLFDDDFLAANYSPTHPRIENLKRGYATPVDLLNSRLEVVVLMPSSHIRNLADVHPQ